MSDLSFFENEVSKMKDLGIFKEIKTIESSNDAYLVINGKRVLNLCSNNYLGLANNPRLKAAATKAIEEYGVGAGAVKVISGNNKLHVQLENDLAKFKKEEAVTLFQSGFDCNAGVISAVTTENDLILSDQLNHASIIDGMRLSKAKRMVYEHSNMQDLELKLKENRDQFEKVLIITDAVFSMDGDLAKLPEIVALAQKYNALTYVDDAHGSGVMGENGRGTVDHFHLHGQVDFVVGTLSKAFGVIGGYVAGKKIIKDYLSQKARPLLFSTNLSPADTAALIEAVKILSTEKNLTEKCWNLGDLMKSECLAAGFDIGHSETPITPLMIGDEALCIKFAEKLLEKGLFVSPIVYPTVPQNKARIRLMVSAAHSYKDIEDAVLVLKETAIELGIL